MAHSGPEIDDVSRRAMNCLWRSERFAASDKRECVVVDW